MVQYTRHLPVQCGPRRWLDGPFVHVTGSDNIIRTELAEPADRDAARWLTWWRSPAGRRFWGGAVPVRGGKSLRVELAATAQGRFVILYAVRDSKGRILPGPSTVQAGCDPNEVFDGILEAVEAGGRLPVAWLS